jgi:anti-sigma regulatory factor (Ser/Thr protein kinase)/anti-anti-sigma regulatory factor
VSLAVTTTPELAGRAVVVSLSGELTLVSIPDVRNTLLKCFAQAPEAVIVDLTELRVPTRSLLIVFPTAARHETASAVALLVCGASPAVRAMTRGGLLRDIAVFDTCEQAVAAVATARVTAVRRVDLHLQPTAEAPARAREMVEEACRSWQIEHLLGPATVVVSELVSNAVQHAGTDIAVTASLRGNYLHVSVRDGSPRIPVPVDLDDEGPDLPDRHYGLYLVDVYTSAWGSTPTLDGKTVWATLRATPVSLR